jgi:5-methylcytosine-specific restriction enzyme A
MRKPKHPCGQPGCRALIAGSAYCAAHQLKRPSARRQGYSSRWDAYSKHFLASHPFCCDPFDRHRGRLVQATVTGHRIAHKGDFRLLWDKSNHYPLCVPCNAYQCATQEGGFGRPKSATA